MRSPAQNSNTTLPFPLQTILFNGALG